MLSTTRWPAVCGLLAISVLFGVAAAADGTRKETRDNPEYIAWGWPVASAQDSSPRVAQLADKLQQSLGIGIKIGRPKQNPGCCLWLEIDPWRPNPSQSAYIVVIQPGGGRILASDEEQLEAAVDALLKASRRRGNQVELPVGLLTN